ncbi:MAG: ComF family protein [Deltaproteobacteria bacterium]|nr:ComF family protein [Deltaproteobacteria bacterium]
MPNSSWPDVLQGALRSIGYALFPPTCAACGESVFPDVILCDACDVSCLMADDPFIICESYSSLTNAEETEETKTRLLDDVKTFSPFLYGGSVKDLLCRAKFTNDESSARAVVALLRRDDVKEGIQTAFSSDEIDAISFIPTPMSRRMRRGFCLAAFVADELARILELPVDDVLNATRTDAPLSTTENAEERRKMVQGRYRMRSSAEKKSYLVADDILTTGSTLHEAASVLKSQGCDVFAFALAQTERDSIAVFEGNPHG